MRIAFISMLGIAATIALAQTKGPEPVHPTTMVVRPWTPVDWSKADSNRLAEAVAALTAARDGLVALAEKNSSVSQEVLLDLTDGLMTYDNHQVRPMPLVAPQWRDMAGQSLDRIRGPLNYDFAPGREDVRMTFRHAGGKWFGPELGMLTSKFRARFHLKGCADMTFEIGKETFTGRFELAAARGDRRFPMHFSGEANTITLAEFRQWKDFSSGFWPDWWGGPRERLTQWKHAFALNALQRRGWLLKAVRRAGGPAKGFSTDDQELFAWVEDGRILRRYAIVPGKLPGRGPELNVSLTRWSVGNGKLEAGVTFGTSTNEYALCATLPAARR